MYAMVDCNNFYASCERVFRPDLATTPIAVLSNNDGCVIARSAECKQIDLPMGMPTFKARNLIRRHGVQVFSSNYALYADISSRVMSVLEEMALDIEVYSIDEAFMVLSSQSNECFAVQGQSIKRRVRQFCGMPVSVGIAPTKTLSKLANYAAKKYTKANGVIDLSKQERQRKLMELTPVGEVWGIGRNMKRSLNALGIQTALDLCDAPIKELRRRYSVVLEKTINELRGMPCIGLESEPPAKREIVCSRSFGHKVNTIDEMAIAISSHVERAGRKLRQEKRLTSSMSIFIRTNRYAEQSQQSRPSATMQLLRPTNDTAELNQAAQRLLQRIWQKGYAYQRAGVMLHGLLERQNVQYELFHPEQHDRSQRLMSVMDQINQRYQNAMCYASTLPTKQYNGWLMRRDHLSPAYTTRWSDLLRVS